MRLITKIITFFCILQLSAFGALPALLVTVGLGAAMAGFLGNHPELIWISENKEILFVTAGILMAVNGALMYKNRNAPCVSRECASTRQTSKWIYFISLGIYIVGVLFAYVLPYI